MATLDDIAEWPAASVQPPFVADHDLWIACAEDPTLFLYTLRMQGRVGPPSGWAPILVPQAPVNPLPLL